jgi:uncharacterized protein YjbI with pentapeptide repeats
VAKYRCGKTTAALMLLAGLASTVPPSIAVAAADTGGHGQASDGSASAHGESATTGGIRQARGGSPRENRTRVNDSARNRPISAAGQHGTLRAPQTIPRQAEVQAAGQPVATVGPGVPSGADGPSVDADRVTAQPATVQAGVPAGGEIASAITQVFDAAADWLADLPVNGATELMQGALLMLRRNLFADSLTVGLPGCVATKDCSAVDLHDVSLTGADLAEVNFDGAILRGANLYGAKLNGANLANADLTDVNLSSVDLRGAVLNDATLAGAVLRRADLTDVNLEDRVLVDVDFTDAILVGADFDGAEFVNSDLSGADLRNASLENVEFVGTDIDRMNLRGADIDGSLLPGAETSVPVRGSSLLRSGLVGLTISTLPKGRDRLI